MTILNFLQILISVALIGVVLLQVKGGGLGSAFGQPSTGYRARRGLDKTLFNTTIFLIAAFVLISIASVRFS